MGSDGYRRGYVSFAHFLLYFRSYEPTLIQSVIVIDDIYKRVASHYPQRNHFKSSEVCVHQLV